MGTLQSRTLKLWSQVVMPIVDYHFIRENVQYLSNVYVNEYWRREGICTEMLNVVDNHAERPNTIVYVDEWAPDYVREMYAKRGYIVLNN